MFEKNQILYMTFQCTDVYGCPKFLDMAHPRKMSTAAKKHECLECGKAFGRKGDLKRHTVVHTEEKNYQCSECGKAFGQKGTLKTHMVVHTKEKKLSVF